MTISPLIDYFRCPEHVGVLRTSGAVRGDAGYFRFGGAICFGRQAGSDAARRPDEALDDIAPCVSAVEGVVQLPFDLPEVLDNLRYERYPQPARSGIGSVSASSAAHDVYYFFRPLLPIAIRKHLQKLRLAGWKRIAFPRWPVDVTVETVMKRVVASLLRSGAIDEFPFIWFWPNGATGALMVTHDVEGRAGVGRVGGLMDLDERFGIRAAFQVVPEAKASRAVAEQCRRRGFEVNVHDYNHDGHLFSDPAIFERRAREINRYVREYGCRGFRAGAMHRRQDWFHTLDVAFDMSVPNVAHLEAQQGGCCTVMPHFIGNVLELPLTTAQDYSLFHVLGDYSTELWREQIASILAENGLASFIIHPDYQAGPRELKIVEELFGYVAGLRDTRGVWMALPSEVDAWWRQRREMRLVRSESGWRIEGPGAERAQVAFARRLGDGVVYELAPARLAA